MKAPDALDLILTCATEVAHGPVSGPDQERVRAARPRGLWDGIVTWRVAVAIIRGEDESMPDAAERLGAYLVARVERWPQAPLPSLAGILDMAGGHRGL